MKQFVYKQKKVDDVEALNILNRFDMMFSPSLSSKVNIESYSQKLSQYANWILCTNNEEIVGYIAFYRNMEKGVDYISSICVIDKYRNQHVAMKMLSFMISHAPVEIKDIKLECRKNNESALYFYEKNGFEVINGNETTYLMRKQLKKT